jgi:predicted RNase H-like HicB family nuclease
MYEMRLSQIETESGSQWAADYPEFKGVSGGGDTVGEAVREARESLAAMAEYCKRKDLPMPGLRRNGRSKFKGERT